MPETERVWIDYQDAAQGDLICEHRHGQLLVERASLPVLALPIAPYTVIRVTWREDEGARDMVRVQAPQESMWQTLTTGPVKYWGDEMLRSLILSFEIVAEPRAVTARAVLARVGQVPALMRDAKYLDRIAREFEEGQP